MFNYVIFSRVTIKHLKYELIVNTDVIAENDGRLKWDTSYMKPQINKTYLVQVSSEVPLK